MMGLFTYNASGQQTAVTYGNGVTSSVTSSFTYSPSRGWLTRIVTAQGATSLLDFTYTRNAAGMITAITSPDPVKTWAYTYDGFGRLLLADRASGTAQDVTYRYDDAGNMVYNSALGCGTGDNLVYPDGNGASAGQGLASGHPHAPSSICGTAVSYDLNGNTLSYDSDGSGTAQPRSFTYDGENRPIAINQGGSIYAKLANFQYS